MFLLLQRIASKQSFPLHHESPATPSQTVIPQPNLEAVNAARLLIYQCWKSSHVLAKQASKFTPAYVPPDSKPAFSTLLPTQHARLWHAAIDSTENRNQHVCHLRYAFGSVNETWRLIISATSLLSPFAVRTSRRLLDIAMRQRRPPHLMPCGNGCVSFINVVIHRNSGWRWLRWVVSTKSLSPART